MKIIIKWHLWIVNFSLSINSQIETQWSNGKNYPILIIKTLFKEIII